MQGNETGLSPKNCEQILLMWAVHYLLKRDLSGSTDSTFRFLNDQKLFGKVDFLKPRCNLKRYNFNNSIHVMLEFVSKLKFYFAPRNLFVSLIGILVLGILKV